jgi:diguanylate cyclase (GGDEF)-like protein
MGSTLSLEYNNARATMSCGISEYPAHGATGNELITLADKAMYQAKAKGRNQVIVWQAELEE